jgi:hypothetical protein
MPWLYAAGKLTVELVYVTLLLWLALSLLDSLGLSPTHIIIVEAPHD